MLRLRIAWEAWIVATSQAQAFVDCIFYLIWLCIYLLLHGSALAFHEVFNEDPRGDIRPFKLQCATNDNNSRGCRGSHEGREARCGMGRMDHHDDAME